MYRVHPITIPIIANIRQNSKGKFSMILHKAYLYFPVLILQIAITAYLLRMAILIQKGLFLLFLFRIAPAAFQPPSRRLWLNDQISWHF